MLVGADTGFFVAFANQLPRAMQVWQELSEGQHTLVVSTLTITEILAFFYRRGGADQAQQWVDLVSSSDGIRIVPVSVEIAAAAAGYRHGLGLPTVDSIVLSTFAGLGCERMLTTDGHFRIAEDQRVIEVEFLR